MITRFLRRSALLALFCSFPMVAIAQTPNIKSYLMQIANGYTAEAKKALPDLLIDNPDDPGVIFLHASLADEPKRSIPLLERISTVYPKSEWADDALLRIILYAAANKETERARRVYAQLRDNYSQSELLPVAYDALRMSIGAPPPPEKSSGGANVTTKKNDKVDSLSKIKFTIQSKPTATKASADKLLKTLQAKKMNVKLVTIPGKTPSYAVNIGEYGSEADAKKELPTVNTTCKCSATVVKK